MSSLIDHREERLVLATMLADPESIPEIASEINAGCFSTSSHRELFTSLVEMSGQDQAIDPVLLKGYLERTGKLNLAGGQEYLVALASEQPLPSDAIPDYCKVIRRQALQSRLECTLMNALGTLQAKPVESEEEIHAMMSEIERNFSAGLPEPSGVVEYNEGLKKLREAGEIQRGLLTGFVGLDSHIDIRPGQLWVVYGDTGHRKTTLAMNFVVHWARTEPVLFISYEQNPDELVRMVKNILREDEEFPKDRLLFLAKAPFIEVIAAVVRRWKNRYSVRIFVLDYLQIIPSLDRKLSENETERVIFICNTLKTIARNEDVSFLILAQMRKQSGDSSSSFVYATDKGLNPELDRIRGSGEVKHSAHVILSVVCPFKLGHDWFNEMPAYNMVLVRIKKNRECLTGDPGEERCFELFMQPGSRRITEEEPAEDFPEN